ncbi:MAG: VWA domain-containing protein [Armatimonadetes bacterium]|nr:VWA domain-containing protein [Armatimonadota bacterium]
MIRFTAPAVALALLGLPLLALLLRRRSPRRLLVMLRMVVIGLLVLGAAGLEVTRAAPDLAVVFAADRSDSMGPDGARLLRGFLDEVRARTGPAHRVGLVTFGAEAALEESLTSQPRLALVTRPRSDGTNIARAIERSLAALPEGRGGRIVLLTDGQATAGNLDAALAAVRSRGIELTVVPVASPPGPEVMVEDVSMPAVVSIGERLPVTVTLRATAAAEGHLRVRANGVLLLGREVTLRPGRTYVDLEPVAIQPGLLRVEASIEATPDGEAGNNRAFALAFVQGRPFVLYVGTPPAPLAQALEVQGLVVRRVQPTELPSSPAAYQGTAAVVLDDVPAYLLSPQQQAALRDYVRLGGGGLVAVGGSRSFGIGGYAGTPLEDALPVSMDVRHRLAIPSMAIVLVLDASGSMGSFGTELAKVELAKETAQSVIDLLGERDLVGVIAFDQVPRWLVPLTPAAQRARILEAVSRIKAGGGTNLYPALVAARDALRRAEAKVKHVIVLSDGQTDPGDFRGLAGTMAEDRMTISTVAIGRDADVEIMRNIAGWGRGRAYIARDLYSIPQILTAEAMLATRAYVIEERFTPRIVGAPAILGDLEALPPLRGYLATAPKPAAEVALQSHQEDPILASWTFGLGRAAAVTTDARLRWTAEWTGWSQAARFWSQVVRWTMSRQTGPLDAYVDADPEQVRIVLDARAADGSPIVAWDARATVVGESGEAGRLVLEQTRPGWYEATTPLPPAGAYMVTVVAVEGGQVVGRAALPLAVPYSPELRQVGLNRALISHLIEAAGARVIATPAEALAPPSAPERRPLATWPLLGAGALAAFVAEVALRRIPAIEYHLGRLAAGAMAFVRRAPPPQELAEDAEYAAADRWRIGDAAEAAARAASMEAAARLYIARLRRQRSDEGSAGGRE